MPRIFLGIRPDRICDAFLSQNFDLLLSPQVDLSDPEQLDGRQLEFMQKKAKVREGEATAQPPQIFNKTYRGVTFFYFLSFFAPTPQLCWSLFFFGILMTSCLRRVFSPGFP